MKATELRINNLVIFDNIEAQVIKIGEVHIEIHSQELQFFPLEITEVEPIPLTEEWLVKFGFEKIEDNDSEYFTIQIGNNLNLTISLTDKTAGIDLEWRSQGSQLWAMIISVHQLQNLFYFLVGEELEVKP